jgi:nicotinamidase/pyrazinamidase
MRTVFFDVDTQNDFMLPAGALYVPGAERVISAVARLNQAAPVLISTTDAHSENDPEFRDWPAHCIRGTHGQEKPAATMLSGVIAIPCDREASRLGSARHYIVEKTKLDAFTNPNLPGLLAALNAERFVVYGVVTEICVRHAVIGLLRLGKPVELVSSAVRSLSDAARDEMLREFTAAGGRVVSLETALSA